ncbi:MAG: hypothetical protein MRJ93_11320 [Nitrososphaeraceae archaeon]|nr:hypothetical protein [Nitrososphaeraceae archaeon]
MPIVHSAHVQDLSERFTSIPFWIWADATKHNNLYIQTKGDCYFNHIIGLPQKNDKEYPLFD